MKKVGVTGLGVICPLGDELETVWQAMTEGKVGTDKLRHMDPAPYRVKIGGEIKSLQRIQSFEKTHGGRYERASVLSILATEEALSRAGFKNSELEKVRVGSFFGTTMGEVQLAERMSQFHFEKRFNEIKPESFGKVQGSRIAFSVLDFLELGGPTMVFSNACASGNYAIGWGFEQIRQGRLDVALCGTPRLKGKSLCPA